MTGVGRCVFGEGVQIDRVYGGCGSVPSPLRETDRIIRSTHVCMMTAATLRPEVNWSQDV